jgi:hypothetical protein
MTIDLTIPILIFIIMFIRHIGNNVNIILNIINKQTKSIELLKNKSLYHSNITEFLMESVKPILEYVYVYGSEGERKEIIDILERWKNGNPKIR